MKNLFATVHDIIEELSCPPLDGCAYVQASKEGKPQGGMMQIALIEHSTSTVILYWRCPEDCPKTLIRARLHGDVSTLPGSC